MDDKEHGMPWANSPLEALRGKIIDRITLVDSKTIRIDTMDGSYDAVVEGDCCSVSYWYAIIHGNFALGTVKEIISVRSRGFANELCFNDDSIQEYGIGLVFANGVADRNSVLELWFVNESNGYYGGWMELKKVG